MNSIIELELGTLSLYWTLIDQEQDDPSFPHWKKGIHPSDEMIRNSIERKELYVLVDGGEIAACVIADNEKVDGYSDAPWQVDSEEVIVLHVLAVHPDHRGKGLARKLIENVIEQERKAGNRKYLESFQSLRYLVPAI